MRPLSANNVESELSYAYLHAVASAAGAACSVTTRHEDNSGVDAKIVGWGPFPNGGYRHEVNLKVQLKARLPPRLSRNAFLFPSDLTKWVCSIYLPRFPARKYPSIGLLQYERNLLAARSYRSSRLS
jgi:hypothetical protein